jgi:hypothetical protein
MLFEDLDRLVEPARVHDHAGGGNRSFVEDPLQRHVAGVAEPKIIRANDQANLVVAVQVPGGNCRRFPGGLSGSNREPKHRQQDRKDDSHQ